MKKNKNENDLFLLYDVFFFEKKNKKKKKRIKKNSLFFLEIKRPIFYKTFLGLFLCVKKK